MIKYKDLKQNTKLLQKKIDVLRSKSLENVPEGVFLRETIKNGISQIKKIILIAKINYLDVKISRTEKREK